MAARRLRTITLDGSRYLWRLGHRVERRDDGTFTAHYTFVAHLDGRRLGPLEIHFETCEDVVRGGPLHTGLPLDRRDPASPSINLNRPAEAAALIRKARAAGWAPEHAGAPFIVPDGIPWITARPS